MNYLVITLVQNLKYEKAWIKNIEEVNYRFVIFIIKLKIIKKPTSSFERLQDKITPFILYTLHYSQRLYEAFRTVIELIYEPIRSTLGYSTKCIGKW